MKRIRYLGVALVAAFSLMAMLGVASAGASGIVSEASIKAAPSGLHSFVPGSSEVISCTAPNFEVKGPVLTKAMDSGALGNYTACEFWGSTTMKTNGCHLIFRPGVQKTVSAFGGTFEIGPAGCGPLSIEFLGGCKWQIMPKAGLSAEYINSGSGTGARVTVNLSATGLETVGSGCGKGGTNGTYSGTYVLTSSTGVHVSESKTKFFVSGQESKGEKPKFNASAYPSLIEGFLWKALVFKSPTVGTATCGSASLSSLMSTATDTADFRGTLTCAPVFGFESSITEMNGCYFRFQVLTGSGAPTWGGKSSIGCANAGEAIKISPTLFGAKICTLSIPAQEIDSTATYEEHGETQVSAAVDREGLTYSGSGQCGSGTASDATLNATFLLGPGLS